MNTQTHKFYKGWFTFGGVRGRLSFIGASLMIMLVAIIITTVINIFTQVTMAEAMTTWIIGIVVASVLTVMVMIQRIRHCVGTDAFKIILLFLLSVGLPFVSIIWLVWPGQVPRADAPSERITPTL